MRNDLLLVKDIYEGHIENAKRVKISEGGKYLIVIIENTFSFGLFIERKTGFYQASVYTEKLAHDMIDALGGVEDIGIEKLMAVLLIDEIAGEEE